MIRVKIPSPQVPGKYDLEQGRQELGLDTDVFLSRYMELIVRDISFPCQPVFKYENVSLEHGEIYADIDPETLPDYLDIKWHYRLIDSSLLELVTETLVGAEVVNKGTMNHDNLIACKPKSGWDPETVNAYLWALIRTVRSNNGLTLSEQDTMEMYMEDMGKSRDIEAGKSITVTPEDSIALADQYLDTEGLASIMEKHTAAVLQIAHANKDLDYRHIHGKITAVTNNTKGQLRALSGKAVGTALIV